MAFTPGSNDGTLNGSTEVTLVAAPGSSIQRMVKEINIQNRDTAVVTLTVRYKSAGGTRQIWSGTLQVGDVYHDDSVYVLDTTGKSIAAVLSGAPATTNPDFVVSYADGP
jgi:hypothetical protein